MKAVIDIGSNSIRLLIADYKNGKLIEKVNLVQTTRLLSVNEFDFDKKIKLSVNALKKYLKLIDKNNCVDKFVFATFSLRNNPIKMKIKNYLEKILDCEIKILTESEEAEYGFLPILEFFDVSNRGEKIGIIDIGGGSTEVSVISRKKNEIVKHYVNSFEIGALSLKKMFFSNNEYTTSNNIKTGVYLSNIFEELGKFELSECFGIGGTITTLAAVDLALQVYEKKTVNGYLLYLNRMKKLSKLMKYMSPEEIKLLPGVFKSREQIVYPGLFIFNKILDKLDIKYLKVSDYGPLYCPIIKNMKKM